MTHLRHISLVRKYDGQAVPYTVLRGLLQDKDGKLTQVEVRLANEHDSVRLRELGCDMLVPRSPS